MSIFGSVFKTIFDVATTPIDVVKDVATLGGTLTGQSETYTGRKLRTLDDDLEQIGDDLEDL